jgi:uncharacterized protein (DUF4415 family)
MPESKRALGSDLAKIDATTDEDIARQIAEDPDTAPEWTDEDFARAEIWHGNRYLGRGKVRAGRGPGRPKGSGKKELVTLHIDREILDRFRAGGPGWQTRLNDALGTVEGARRAAFAEGYAAAMKVILDQAETKAPTKKPPSRTTSVPIGTKRPAAPPVQRRRARA